MFTHVNPTCSRINTCSQFNKCLLFNLTTIFYLGIDLWHLLLTSTADKEIIIRKMWWMSFPGSLFIVLLHPVDQWAWCNPSLCLRIPTTWWSQSGTAAPRMIQTWFPPSQTRGSWDVSVSFRCFIPEHDLACQIWFGWLKLGLSPV